MIWKHADAYLDSELPNHLSNPEYLEIYVRQKQTTMGRKHEHLEARLFLFEYNNTTKQP